MCLQMSIQERLQLVLKMHNLTPSVFADKIGVQRSNVSHVISGRNKPSLDFLEKIVVNFPRVNAHWLITGEVQEQVNIHHPSRSIENLGSASDAESKLISSTRKTIVKVITFYSDETFDVYYKSSGEVVSVE